MLAASSLFTLAMRIPGGYDIPEGCVTALSNGALFNASAAPPAKEGCGAAGVESPLIQIYAADVHFKSDVPLTSFTADWVVPPLPSSHSVGRSQVVYFWPGFKAQQPEMGYPVLQPVLQYGERGRSWALQSWFVDAKDPRFPVVTAPEIEVKPGDKLTSFMSLSSDGTTWTVSGTNKNSGEDSTLHIAYSSAGKTDYENAMLVNENINVDEHCDRMPASSGVTFTNVTVNGKSPAWVKRANCAGNPECDCGNAATVDPATGDVTLSWKTSSPVEAAVA